MTVLKGSLSRRTERVQNPQAPSNTTVRCCGRSVKVTNLIVPRPSGWTGTGATRMAVLRRIPLPRLYEKASSASQSPQHEATHSSVHEHLAGCTQLLVVLAHPSVVANPGKGAFHHPAAWEDLKCPRWQKLLPLDYLPSLANSSAQLISTSSGALCADVRPVPHSILKPSPTQPLPFSSPLYPATSHRCEGAGTVLGTIEQRLDPLLVHHVGHVDFRL